MGEQLDLGRRIAIGAVARSTNANAPEAYGHVSRFERRVCPAAPGNSSVKR